jgi:hypothetical protein
VKQTVDTTTSSDRYIDIDQRQHGRHRRSAELSQTVPRGRSNPEDTKEMKRKHLGGKNVHSPQPLVRNATVEKASVVTNEEQSATTKEKKSPSPELPLQCLE